MLELLRLELDPKLQQQKTMPIEPLPQETIEMMASLKKYFREEFDLTLSDLRARLLLEYILKEIGPVAYNAGVKDAETQLRRAVEDLTGTCFEAPLTYWSRQKK